MEFELKPAVQVLSIFLVLATVLPFIRSDHWIIRIFDFPRMQIALSLFLVGTLYFISGGVRSLPDMILITGIFGAFSYQIYKIYPYTRLSPKQVFTAKDARAHPAFKLLVSNVYMYNKNVAEFWKIISRADPDMVLMLETDRWWAEKLADLEKSYPFSVQHPLENTYGMLFFSRLKLIDSEVRFLVEDDVPSIRTTVEIAPGNLVTLYCLHPRPPRPLKNQNTTERDIELIKVGKEIQNLNTAVVAAGDLNDVAWSHTTRLFRKISGLLDPRIGRGLFSSFHAKIPFLRWPLDHVFHSRHFKLITIKRLAYFGSDHFPIFIHLQHHPAVKTIHEAPAANQEDLQEAVEILNKEDTNVSRR